MVAVSDLSQSLNKLYLSAPSYTSSNSPQVPKTSDFKPLTVVYTIAPVAFATLYKSSF